MPPLATMKSATFGRSGLLIPAVCAICAQYLQHIHAVGRDGSDLMQMNALDPLLLSSFLKLAAIVILAFHLARFLVSSNSGCEGDRDDGAPDRSLMFILAINFGFCAIILLGVGFIESEAFAGVAETGLSRTHAKLGLVCLVFALLMPLNRRVFRDVSAAIGSNAHLRARPSAGPNQNKVFLKALTRNAIRYVLPAFALHVLLAAGIAAYPALLAAQALADSLVLVAIGLLAGYAIFLSHREASAEPPAGAG